MRKIRMFLLLFLTVSNFVFGQCIVDDLAKDFFRNSELKNLLNQQENFDAWVLLNKENPALRTSDIEIRFVADNLEDIKSFGGYSKWKKNYEDLSIPTTFTFENANDLAKTFDPYNKLSKHHRGLIYNYYKQASESNGLKSHLWKKIEDIFNEYNLNSGWPLANGGFNAFNQLLKEKDLFDRLGGVLRNAGGSIKLDKNGFPELGGAFTSPIKNGVPYDFESRALRGKRTDYDIYYKIEIIDPKGIKAEEATVIPWFGKKGGAQQSMWKIPIDPSTGYPKTWNKLAEEGYVKITIEDVPSGKAEFLKFKGKVIGADPYLVIKNKFPENLRNLLNDAPEELLTNFKKLDDDGKLEKFIENFKDNTDAFLSFKETPSLVDSWKFVREAIPTTNGATTQFAIDPATLNKVAEMTTEGSRFRTKFPNDWEQELKNILKTAETAPCGACGTANSYNMAFPSMEKHLENVEYFLRNFEANGGGKKFYNWMRGKTETGSEVLNNQGLKHEMAQTLNELKKRGFTETNVEFGAKFKPQSNTSKMSDLRSGDLDIELKNKDFPNADAPNGSLSQQEVEQVLGNEGAFSVKNKLANYQWKYNPLRNNANETNLKKLWQKAFKNTDATKGPTKQQIFDNMNVELKQSLEIEFVSDLTDSKIDEILDAIIKSD